MKKKISKRMGINTKISINNNIYFSNDKNTLNLEDNNTKLIEKNNDTDIRFNDINTNKSILLSKGNLKSFYENKYTIDKSNIINKKLIEKYCINKDIKSNVFIQIIHSYEDIKKILSLYINDVLFSLNSFRSEDEDDVITSIKPEFTIKKEDDKYYIYKEDDKVSGYSDKIVKIIKEIIKKHNFYGVPKNEVKIFEYLKCLSLLRNAMAHSKDLVQEYDSKLIRKEINDYIYSKGKDFLNNSKLNIELISNLYNSDKEDEIEKYYKYYLNELDKNISISIKKIMEQARIIYPSNLDEEKNKKYNVLLKYHLYNYLTKNTKLLEDYVSLLKEKDFDEKDFIYEDLVKTIGKEEFDKVRNVVDKVNFKDKVKTNNEYESIKNKLLNTNYDWNSFSLYIYSLTKFLTIKETNILTSSIKNKLKGISGLINMAKSYDLDVINNLNSNLFMFNLNNVDNIFNEITIINSTRKFVDAKHHDYSKDELIQGINIFKNDLSNEEIDKLIEKKIDNIEFKKKRIKYPIKNFIRNNVITTKEFSYIYRYIDTKIASNILYNNPKLVKFIFSSFSESELERYKSVGVDENTIASVTLDSIIKNLSKGNMEYSSNIKAYIKCIYFLLKNMVTINSYYFIAFTFFVRDMKLVINEDFDNFNTKEELLSLTNMIKHNTNLEQSKKTIDNFMNILGDNNDYKIFKNYRNTIDHININNLVFKTKFPDSFEYKNYFKIFHYAIQKELLKYDYESTFINKCKENIDKYNKYSKNLLYVINSMFMYNYARYKDISTEEIFMKKYN